MHYYSYLELIKVTSSIIIHDEQEKDNTMDNQQVNKNNIKHHPIYTKYSASIEGDVYGVKGNLISLCNDTGGYPSFGLHSNKSSLTTRAHRFIWECHNGLILDKKVINHIDGNKTNNKLSNLELVSQKENVRHAVAIGLQPIFRGEMSPNAIITEEKAKTILRAILENKIDSIIAQEHNVKRHIVTHIRRKECWAHLFELEEFKSYVPKPSNYTREQYINASKYSILYAALCTTEAPAAIAKRYDMSNGTISKIRNLKAPTWVDDTRKFIFETSETIPKGSRTKWFEKVSTLL